ncbi:hypothetical protein Pcinc_003906 [Petrolisthes cinctipes]|uniref:C3H1-type domain-containing protein n=1 Tax=Petrolisthes cinctipes TaxID=88211 RepID=A0AAE1GI38_PETCI|nr:hypothetical protein Pcinc_003906 [Petrolisthes cinctipes]
MSSKTEMKTKVTAPQDKSSSHDTRKANKPSGPKSDNNKPSVVCRFFLKNECSRGSNCTYLHTKPSDNSSNKYSPGKKEQLPVHLTKSGIPKKTEVCRKFIKGTCRRNTKCYYYHPSVEEMRGNQEERVAWFALCPDILSDFCINPQCSFFHITKQNEDMYRNAGEISPILVERAVHMSLAKNLTLIGTMPYCKDYVRGRCNLQDCHLRHMSEGEYKDEVFYALLEEFQQKYGPHESQPFPPQDNFNNSVHPPSLMMSAYSDGMNENPGLLGRFPGDMTATDRNNPSLLEPHPDQEPDGNREMYHHDDAVFPGEDMGYENSGLLGRFPGDKRTADTDTPRRIVTHSDLEPERKRGRYQHDDPVQDMRYDDQVHFEWENSQLPGEKDNLMDQIIVVQKESMNMRREFEGKMKALRERLRKLEDENSKLREDAIEIQVAHKVEVKTLTVSNTTLHQENKELRRLIDSKVKNATSEVQKRLDAAEMEADKARESFTKLNSMLRESETKRTKLVAEIGSLRAKTQDRQGTIPGEEDVQQHNTNTGYNTRDGYSRDKDLQGYSKQGDHPFNKGGHHSMQGQWSGHMEPNRSNEGLMRNPQHSRTMEIPSITEVMKRNYENVERKSSRSQYNTSTRYREEWD